MKAESGAMFSNAQAYESYMGRWSRLVAQKFIAWIDIRPGRVWLDVGAGTGVLTQVILQGGSPAKVVGVDLSPEYIEFARERIRDERVEFKVGDAGSFDIESPPFDVSVAGLVLNFLPEPQQAVRKMAQAVRDGGTVTAYVWDYGGKMEMMRHFWDAASGIDSSANEMDASQRFLTCTPDNLRALFQSVDLRAIEVVPIDIQAQFKDFDDYWLPFLGAQGSVSNFLRGLNDEKRTALRDALKNQLPITDDGGISLVARAWAVKGTRALSG